MERMGLTSTSTNRKHRTTDRTRQTMGLPLPPCPAFLFSNRPSQRCQVRIDRLQTASTNGRPPGGSRTGHSDSDPATRTLVPEASERGSTHCDSVKAAGGGWLKIVRG